MHYSHLELISFQSLNWAFCEFLKTKRNQDFKNLPASYPFLTNHLSLPLFVHPSSQKQNVI